MFLTAFLVSIAITNTCWADDIDDPSDQIKDLARSAEQQYASTIETEISRVDEEIGTLERQAQEAKQEAYELSLFYQDALRHHCPRDHKCVSGVPEEALPKIEGEAITAAAVARRAQADVENARLQRDLIRQEALLVPSTQSPVVIGKEPADRYFNQYAATIPQNGRYTAVPVFFATDREYDGARFTGKLGAFVFGIACVTVPLDHREGSLESLPFFTFVAKWYPERYVLMHEARKLTQDEFLRALDATQQKQHSPEVLMFVHGYNTSFEDALRRAAQLVTDLKFAGPVVCVTWPSLGSEAQYVADRNNAELSVLSATQILKLVLSQDKTKKLHILAHSMGTYVLTNALADLTTAAPELIKKIGNVVLAAADIDSELFKKRILPRLPVKEVPTTLYASSKDLALTLAMKWGGNYPRLGQAGPLITIVPGIYTIDASAIDTSLIGHSYFGDTRSVIYDIYHVITNSLPPDKRGLKPINKQEGTYWLIPR
jgi:esterase/lipase superfamily enzyme